MFAIPLLAVSLAIYPRITSGFSFTMNNTPQQCQNLSISITGSGQPPYSAVILPFGPTPLPNNTEVRKILNVPFNGNLTTTSFQLTYPENSQFVVVVSDSSGFGSGGTSTAAEVQTSSSDSSCFGSSQVAPAFSFSTVPANQLVQCSPIRIWWDPTQTQGSVQFYGVIPGGQSFQLDQGVPTNVTNEGLGFNWTVSVRVSTTVLLAGGDSRGIGTAGSIQQNVQQGDTINNSCLNSSSPSSTPGSPAGGAYPTSSNGVGTGGGGGNNGGSSSGSKSNTGAIVGGTIGGIVAVIAAILVWLFFIRRRRLHTNEKNNNHVDLLQGDGEDGPPDRDELPQFYRPEPFLVPEPSVTSQGPESYDHRQSTQASTTTELLRSGTPDPHGLGVGSVSGSNQTRKNRLGPSLRPVNIIQHDDAGDADDADEGEALETVELPPAYTNIRKPPGTTTTANANNDTANNEAAPSSST